MKVVAPEHASLGSTYLVPSRRSCCATEFLMSYGFLYANPGPNPVGKDVLRWAWLMDGS